jgi:hypothetical protein
MNRPRKPGGLSRDVQLALGEKLRAAYGTFVDRLPPGLVGLANAVRARAAPGQTTTPGRAAIERMGMLDPNVFEPETIALLDEAYQKAWNDLQGLKNNPVSQDALVLRLIALVRAGERSPHKLATKAVLTLIAPSTAPKQR